MPWMNGHYYRFHTFLKSNEKNKVDHCRNLSFGLATKARGCKVAGVKRKENPGVKRKEARESKEGSPGVKAKALEGCRPRGGSPRIITYSRESKEVRGSVRE